MFLTSKIGTVLQDREKWLLFSCPGMERYQSDSQIAFTSNVGLGQHIKQGPKGIKCHVRNRFKIITLQRLEVKYCPCACAFKTCGRMRDSFVVAGRAHVTSFISSYYNYSEDEVYSNELIMSF